MFGNHLNNVELFPIVLNGLPGCFEVVIDNHSVLSSCEGNIEVFQLDTKQRELRVNVCGFLLLRKETLFLKSDDGFLIEILALIVILFHCFDFPLKLLEIFGVEHIKVQNIVIHFWDLNCLIDDVLKESPVTRATL